ncbi:MAG: endonuclease/exonuclease/phosphatase family protein, partial [Candidatus Thiodiazotropha endolucinida]|nr:endonuclease/exonuclease/phosphatase family protein [Candidatus Thiodiazotropha taylori]MCW4346056.1 endonuclease/exonuclease/phosphatase family protein [Candidatus Thiodiazotropha endolucinida]
ISDSDMSIVHFKDPLRCDRNIRAGGVAIYVKDTLESVRRRDLEVKDLECVWVQAKVQGHTILVGGIYRPPNANQNYWNLIHETIDRAKSTNIQDIIILGDLNNDLLVNNRSKNLQELMKAYSLKQLLTEATHFTESSASLIDVILVNKTSNILSSEVCDPFIPNLVRYHCPVALLLKFA